MKKKDKKQIIIEKSAELFHQNGYHNTGLNVILKELQIPKGSFYNYFESKEVLAVEVISWHIANTKILFEEAGKEHVGVDIILSFFEVFFTRLKSLNYHNGCPLGNLMTELSDSSILIRQELLKWVIFLENDFFKLLNQIKPCQEEENKSLASFLIAAFEGVIMKAKVEQNGKAIEQFEKYIIKSLLKEYL
jgi:TetR/AcrR family transcriptional repressor of nem operon